MKIESVDIFYLAMPEIEDVGDGSQDAALVRIRAGGYEGWGQCEASPLVSIAGLVAPMSHSALKPVAASVIGQTVSGPEDISAVNRRVRANSLDMLQADHVLSGIDIALWDLLGKNRGEPVFSLLGFSRAFPKLPYASVLFGPKPAITFSKAVDIRKRGFKAAKFGWEPYGRISSDHDRDQVMAAREGLGKEGILLIDAGTVWVDDVEAARRRLPALKEARATWLEEPFVSGALEAYRALAAEAGQVKLAGGEGCHDYHTARHMIDYAGIGFIQIDTGRIGGITTAREVARYALERGISFVNHTFTSHLSLAASLCPFAGNQADHLCEYPVEPKPVARDLTKQKLVPDSEGAIRLPAGPGLGIEPDLDCVRKYLVSTEISVGGRTIYRTPTI